MPDNRTEAGRILNLPDLVRQTEAEQILGVSKGNLGKVSRDGGLPEPVYARPKQWRRQDVELLAKARARR